MTDVSMAPEQDAIAESLLGEPEEQQTVEATGDEQQEVVQDEPQQVEAEAQTQEEQTDDWLPSDQDKVFPDEVYARYAQRYQLTPEEAANPQLRQLLHDKINTDIFVRQQQQQAEQWEQQQETEPEPEPTQQQAMPLEQWFQNLDQIVQQTTDPNVAKAFHGDFLRAFGVPEADIAKVPPQQAMQFTNVASKYMLNLISTHLPNLLQGILPQQVNQVFPGFGDMYERSAYMMAWDQVRNSNPQYQNLPAFGTKEFSKTLREAQSKFPEIVAAFEDQNGKIPTSKAGQAYAILAKIASGQNVDPALLQKAAASGAAQQRRAATRRAAGNLGSGQSKAASGGSTSSRFQSNSDIFDEDTMALYQREHGRL